jgi:uncharacterized membrane protein (UPF0127 family)
MSASHRIADTLFKSYPNVVERGSTRLPLQEGDLVADRGYAHMPRIPDDSIGRIRAINERTASVEWRDGSRDTVSLDHIARVSQSYEPMLHESAYELPKFKSGTRVLLGNGDQGRVLEQLVGPTGFKSFRIQIDKSVNPQSVGRRVYATHNAMVKVGSLLTDVMAAVFKEGNLEPVATIGCELAVDHEDQVVGLQKYSSMPSDHGMLFPYEPPQRATFHMGNVRFPIDVLFIDPRGRIAAIEENCEPGIEEYWSHGKVSAVLEVVGGWCAEQGVMAGDLVRLVNTKTAQELFDSSRPDALEYQPASTLATNPTERFRGHETPAEQNANPESVLSGEADGAHFDQTIGPDPTSEGTYPGRVSG